MLDKLCLQCGQTIMKPQNESLKNWHTRHKFCSRKCADEFWIGKRKSQTGFTKGHISWLKGTKGLVKSNSGSFQKGNTPPFKGKRFPHVTGEKNSHWKGGITPLMEKIRQLPEYKNWKNQIFQRDNWTCECGKRGGNLHAHHTPKLFSQIVKENKIDALEKAISCQELWDISNGRTLCLVCHQRIHRISKKINGLV